MHEKFNLKECGVNLRGEILLRNGKWIEILIDLRGAVFFKSLTPRVFCDALWLNKGADWHTYKELNEICWVYGREWDFYIQKWIHEEPCINEMVAKMVEYLYRNVEHLLNVHLVAFENGISEWLPEWGGYPHGDEAAKKKMLENIKIKEAYYLT